MLQARKAGYVALALLCLFLSASTRAQEKQGHELTVTGKLTRVMAIGAETSGWAIELDPPVPVDGKSVTSLEIAYSNVKKLEKLKDQHVKAVGILIHRQGVETGDRVVLELSSVKRIKS
jgi:hypothetical protein